MKSAMENRTASTVAAATQSTIGFTIVELLVVITILVVLLALLTPAMDKAIYQAELAVCGARLKALGSGVQGYALQFERAYPDRPAAKAKAERHVYLVAGDVSQPVDDRPIIQDFVSLALLLCPLDGKISIGIHETDPTSYVWSNYALWYGWAYRGQSHGMRRMGDRITYDDHRYALLASDWDAWAPDFDRSAEPYTMSTHPDKNGRLRQQVYQNVEYPIVGNPTIGTPAIKVTSSFWDGWTRGPLDNNFVYDDGSVRGIVDSGLHDSRLDGLPYFLNPAASPARRIYVPKE